MRAHYRSRRRRRRRIGQHSVGTRSFHGRETRRNLIDVSGRGVRSGGGPEVKENTVLEDSRLSLRTDELGRLRSRANERSYFSFELDLFLILKLC